MSAAADKMEAALRLIGTFMNCHHVAARNLSEALAAYETEKEQSTLQLTDAARDVLAERQRQISAEGWFPEHDDQHDGGDLAFAAACYATATPEGFSDIVQWPWDAKWWKPKGPRRNLVKAGALILAEIERLDRSQGASS